MDGLCSSDLKTGLGGTYQTIATPGANLTNYSDSGLKPATPYYYRVRADNAGGESASTVSDAIVTPLPHQPTLATPAWSEAAGFTPVTPPGHKPHAQLAGSKGCGRFCARGKRRNARSACAFQLEPQPQIPRVNEPILEAVQTDVRVAAVSGKHHGRQNITRPPGAEELRRREVVIIAQEPQVQMRRLRGRSPIGQQSAALVPAIPAVDCPKRERRIRIRRADDGQVRPGKGAHPFSVVHGTIFPSVSQPGKCWS